MSALAVNLHAAMTGMNVFCVIGIVGTVAALYFFFYAIFRVAGQADDWAEKHDGVRRS